MEYKDWLILKTIHEERNITKTAERLYISQPALTYRLQNMEKDMGVKILNRHKNGVSFTPQGEYLLKYSEEMLEKLEYVKEHVRNMESFIKGTIQLGVSSVIAKFKIAPLLRDFQKQYPQVQVILHTGSSTLHLPEMIEKRVVDIALLRGEVPWQGHKHVISEEPICIISSQPISLDLLPQTPWIQYEAAVITGSEEEFYDWWKDQFSPPPPEIIRVDSIEACIQMVSHGLGWCIAPKIHITNRRSLFYTPVVFRDGHTMVRKTMMFYQDDALKQQAVKLFIDHVLYNYSK